jgi:asparagine synthase (glutamine-hydrolysing)
MCGIVGIIRKNEFTSEFEIKELVNQIKHRGPDGVGFYNKDNFAVGHSRLSIIDLKSGSQPMFDINKKIIITFNGEIYNYKELKIELTKSGYQFHSDSDTEVLINAYKKWGKNCLLKLRGMFAFCIVDLEKQLFFLARDYFGIKPLNYRTNKDYFSFCSEIPPLIKIKGTLPKGNLEALDDYLKFQFIPDPDTIYDEVYKLEPGCYMTVSFRGEILSKEEYWTPNFTVNKSYQQKHIENEIFNSVKAHLVSDVPFGVLLSGGIDSTLITMFMAKILDQKISAFSIGFEEAEYNETNYAEIVANKLKIDLHKKIITQKDVNILPEIILNHIGEPFGDDSILPTSLLMKSARSSVPMVLSGDGGDETFAGYSYYGSWLSNHPIKYSTNLVKQMKIPKIPRFISGSFIKYINNNFSTNFLDEWIEQQHIGLSISERSELWNSEFKFLLNKENSTFNKEHKKALKLDRVSYGQYLDIKTNMNSSILRKVDISSMIHGLEVRTPFLDKRLSTYFLNLNRNQKFTFINKKFEGKMPLKKIVENIFGKEFTYRQKRGFSLPRKNWFQKGHYLYEMLSDLVSSESNRLNFFFNTSFIEKKLKDHTTFNNNSKLLWQVLILGIWLEGNKNIKF